jgi:hypothetical protein
MRENQAARTMESSWRACRCGDFTIKCCGANNFEVERDSKGGGNEVGQSIRYAFIRTDYSDNAATAAAHGAGLMLLDNPTLD